MLLPWLSIGRWLLHGLEKHKDSELQSQLQQSALHGSLCDSAKRGSTTNTTSIR
jgi:hypothetical protein